MAERRLPINRSPRTHAAGEEIYRAGGDGLAWRIRRGAVRLDTVGVSGESSFASLAVRGDIIGCESMLFGSYTFAASALVQCELSPWPEGEAVPAGESLLQSLAWAQKRAADVLALRGGEAMARVLGLVRLLADGSGSVVLPARHDIADITDLRFETISRIIKRLERAAVLLPVRICGVHATRSFSLNLAGLSGL